MTKEQEIMAYLQEKVFDPVLQSGAASKEDKKRIRFTIMCMNKLSAESMIEYFNNSLLKCENDLSRSLKDKDLPSFNDVETEFNNKFNEIWLKN